MDFRVPVISGSPADVKPVITLPALFLPHTLGKERTCIANSWQHKTLLLNVARRKLTRDRDYFQNQSPLLPAEGYLPCSDLLRVNVSNGASFYHFLKDEEINPEKIIK